MSDSVLPSWLPTSFEGFRNLVIGVISAWLVGGLIGVGESLVDAVLSVWGAIDAATSPVTGAVETIVGRGSDIPLLVLDVAQSTIAGVASSTGPLAPIVVVLLWGATVLAIVYLLRATVRLARFLWRLIPVT